MHFCYSFVTLSLCYSIKSLVYMIGVTVRSVVSVSFWSKGSFALGDDNFILICRHEWVAW